jgi:hypothetical protein
MIMNKLLLVLLLLVPASAWWDPDWNFSKTVTTTDDASLITGWFTLDTESLISSGKMRHDCGDTRMTKDESAIGYYMTGCNTTYTNVFFEVDYSGDTHNLYYGNPAATGQSSSSVFSFYDNFESYSTGSDGSTTWTVRGGSFEVRYQNNSQRYVVNTTAESIATSYAPSGNFSVFAELGTPGNGNPGLVYSYVGSSEYYAAYLNGSEVWIRNGTVHAKIGDFTSQDFNYMLVEVVNGMASVYVNGNLEGVGNYSSGSVGVYALPEGTSHASIDGFAVFPSAGVSWSLGTERTRPQIVLQFVGSEAANMRTIVAHMSEGDNMLRIQLESVEEGELVEDNSAQLSWGNITFNSTGYAVNGSFVKVDSDEFNYTQGKYRFELRYVKTDTSHKKWHVVQFFYNFPAIKHIVFLTANQSGSYPVDIYPWNPCSSYVNNTGNHSCGNDMHSSVGVFRFGGSSLCGLHWADPNTFRVYDNITLSSKGYKKEIFWHSYMGCDKFTEEVEVFCGTDFSNCTATPIIPVKMLFYVNDEPRPLSRIEYPSGFSCTLNGESFTELVDYTKINKGLNDLQCSGSGNLTYFRLYSSHPYETTRFFDEKPETYRIEIAGPASRGKLRICGIPLFDKILPFKCSGNNLFFEGDFLNGTQDFYIFKTKRSWSYIQAQGGPEAQVKVTRMEPPQPPLAAAKELGPPNIPPTHKVINSRRLFYSNSTVVEVVITAWRSI